MSANKIIEAIVKTIAHTRVTLFTVFGRGPVHSTVYVNVTGSTKTEQKRRSQHTHKFLLEPL